MTLVLTIATKCGGEYWLVNIKPVQVGWRTSNNATSNSIKLSMVCSPPVYLLWRLSLPIYQHNTVIINVSVDLCQFGIFSTSLLYKKAINIYLLAEGDMKKCFIFFWGEKVFLNIVFSSGNCLIVFIIECQYSVAYQRRQQQNNHKKTRRQIWGQYRNCKAKIRTAKTSCDVLRLQTLITPLDKLGQSEHRVP